MRLLIHDNKKVKWLVLIGCSLLIAAPRFIGISHPSLSYDEYMDYVGSINFNRCPDLSKPITLEGYRNGQFPWFSAWLLYRIIDCSEKTARLNSVLASLLGLGFVFLIVKRINGFWWAVITAACLGLAPFYISASRLAFTHGHLYCTLPILAGLYFLLKLYHRTQSFQDCHTDSINCSVAGICFGLGVGCDPIACFWLVNGLAAVFYWSYKKVSLHTASIHLILYCLGSILGLFVASPMYFDNPVGGIMNMLAGINEADSWRGFLWLGNMVEVLPCYYYIVVGITKLTPAVLILVFVTLSLYIVKFRWFHSFYQYLFLSLWPISYLSIKPAKSPYYLIPFIPVIYILLVDALHRLFSFRVFKTRYYLKAAVLLLVMIGQLTTIIQIHPDYLMLGIQYSDKFYGEFQGPAISHGQWIGEAFEFIKKDSDGQSSMVYTFEDIAVPQIKFYSGKYSNIRVSFGKPPTSNENVLDIAKENIYVVLNQDAKKLISPCHKETIHKNKKLVDFMTKTNEYSVIKAFKSGNYPMLWIYKKATDENHL